MYDESKLEKMFYIVFPELIDSTGFTVEVCDTRLDVIKGSNLSWSITAEELLFAYITREWE